MELPEKNKGGRPRLEEGKLAKKVSITFTGSDWERVCKYGEKHDWSASQIVRKALDVYFRQVED